jgi:DNA-binding transcriptional LysR family regulator
LGLRLNLEDLKTFMVVAETGSLSAGARKLDMSVATVGRRIDALEEFVGCALLRRGRAGISLSEAGRRLLESARPPMDRLADVARLAAALKAASGDPPLRISATEPIVSQVLAPALPLLRRQADITVELLTSTGVANFDRHECDLAVRLFRPTGDNLLARRLPDIEMGLFASASYLAGRDPESLVLGEEHLLLISDSYGRIAEVGWAAQHGLDAAAIMKSSSSSALIQAARAGAGIAIAPRFLAGDLCAIAAPAIPPRQCWLVSHVDARRSRRHRLTAAWVAGAFKAAVA